MALCRKSILICLIPKPGIFLLVAAAIGWSDCLSRFILKSQNSKNENHSSQE
jgi:hypothetical protein